MTALEVKEDTWFMNLRNKKWYKKESSGSTFTKAYILGTTKEYLIPNDEKVEVRK